jgi:hypothetical protein
MRSSRSNDKGQASIVPSDAVIQAASAEFVKPLAVLKLCPRCAKGICKACQNLIDVEITSQARQLINNKEFRQHCVDKFIMNLEDAISTNSLDALIAEIQNRRKQPKVAVATVMDDDDDLEEELISSIVSYQEKARKEPIAEKTIARQSIQKPKPVARKEPAKAPEKPKVAGKAPSKPPGPKAKPAKAKPIPSKKRDREEEPIPPRENPDQSEDTDIEHISGSDYRIKQVEKTKVLLEKMKQNVETVKKIYHRRGILQVPEFEKPNPTLATREGISDAIDDTNRMRLLLNVGKSTAMNNVKMSNRLDKWCKLINHCYAFAGLLKEFGKYRRDDQVEDYERARSSYGKVRTEFSTEFQKQQKNPATFIPEATLGIPTFGDAVMYAQIGDFLVQYPKFLYQTELVTFKAWTQLILEKSKCDEPIRERRVFAFIRKIFATDNALGTFWRQEE